jgi:phosphate:Na+ symporter
VTVTLIGGVGLFLLGMVLLTDGLKAAAGEALRAMLVRFTGGPVRAMLSGAAATALAQSSTATVVTTIGFVSAGLLTFPQAVGVVFGANLGTTSTGWIVALLGLKLSIGAVALPMVAAGAALRLLTRGRTAQAGLALAGFGLIFVGIDTLQEGMEALSQRVDPGVFPGGTFLGRLILVGIGVVMTVVMQSSSAAVATTLTALHGGAIELDQAAALVVGQNIGTTVTTALAAIGGSVAARRTAAAHILFNLLTGTIAFALIGPLLRLDAWMIPGTDDPALVIAAFHTGFNLIGVLVLMPLTRSFAGLVTRIVPESGDSFTRHLDPSVARIPAVAVEAARRTVLDVFASLLRVFMQWLDGNHRGTGTIGTLERADAALGETRRFLALAQASGDGMDQERHVAILHAIDHLDRLIERLLTTPPRVGVSLAFRDSREQVRSGLAAPAEWLVAPDRPAPTADLGALSDATAAQRRQQRDHELRDAAAGRVDPDVVMARLDAMRWLDSSTYHVWRAFHHLATQRADTQAERRD